MLIEGLGYFCDELLGLGWGLVSSWDLSLVSVLVFLFVRGVALLYFILIYSIIFITLES